VHWFESVSEYTWRNCLEIANGHQIAMDFEGCVQCCLSYLQRYLIPPSNETVAHAAISKSLRVIFACGGNGSRWGRFLNMPKQQVDTGDGLPLIQRTINQFRCYMPDAPFHILIREGGYKDFNNINSANIITTVMNDATNAGIEVLENVLVNPLTQSNILIIYGDVYFSKSAVETIVKTICGECNHPKYFGRKHQNKQFGNNGGEIFGVYIPFQQQELLLTYYKFIDRMYLGFPMYRRSSWEVLALLGLMHKQETGEHGYPYLLDNDARNTYNQIIKVLQEREFNPMTWIEIDDETEDFDFPCEYINRLMLTVHRVGITLDSQM